MIKTKHYYRPFIVAGVLLFSAGGAVAGTAGWSHYALVNQEALHRVYSHEESAIEAALAAICPEYSTRCGFDPALHPAPRKPVSP